MADIDSVSAAAMECWDRVSRQESPWLPEPALDWLIDRTGWDLRRAVREVGEAAAANIRKQIRALRPVRRELHAARTLLEIAAARLVANPAAARKIARAGQFSASTALFERSFNREVADRGDMIHVADNITAAADLLDRLRTAAA